MMKNSIVALIVSGLLFVSCARETYVAPGSEKVRYEGRVALSDTAAVFYWPGNSVETRFRGTELYALMRDGTGKNYLNVIVDEDSIIIFRPDTLKKWCPLVTGLKDTVHTVELFMRTAFNPFWFYGFKTDKKGEFLPLPPPAVRKMEFYGNSITEGASVHDYSGNDRWDSTFTDNYVAYGAVTARHYHASYTCIARGGIGLLVSWYPLIMPEMWDRLNPDDPESKWDFSKYTPDIVVVNLFQNDAPLFQHPEHPQIVARFHGKIPGEKEIVAAYQDFIKKIREVYPRARIICTLGSMNAVREDRPWRGYVKKAVEGMHDPDIYYYFFFYKGGLTHPQEPEQRRMADSLINFIDKHIKW